MTCALALIVATGIVPAGETLPEGFGGKDVTQTFKTLEPGQAVRVVNRFGNVYARFGGYERRVEILATAQRLEAETPLLTIDHAQRDDALRIAVGREGDLRPGPDTRDRIDLVVFVPAGARFDVETGDGLIAIKKLKSDVVASSIRGDVRIRSVTGSINAKTSRGAIEVTLETGVTDAPQELSTLTGEIQVWVGEDADMSVDVATSGEISTDFSMQIEHHRFEEPSKHAAAQVGRGGPRLTLRSKQGRVRLLRLQKRFKPEE